jgi:hypothetical protein
MQFAVPGVYQFAVMPVSGTSNLIKLDMNTGYTSMSEPFRMTVVSSELQLGLYGSTNQQPMTVLVTDQMQKPVSGVNVYFADNDKTFAAWTGYNGTASAPVSTFTYDAQYGSVKFITVYIVDPTGAIMPGLVSTFKMFTYMLQGGTTNLGHIPYSITPIDPTIVRGTVGSTLSSNPLNVVVTDESGIAVSGTGVEFDVCDGDATFGSGQKSMVTFTNQYGIASTIVTLGMFTNDYPTQMQINANDPYLTQVELNSICVSALSVNNVRLNDAFHVLALPGPPAQLLSDIYDLPFQTDLPNHPLYAETYYVLDMHNNPVANSLVEFSVLDATPTTTGSHFINAKLYDDTPISATFTEPCSEGGAPSYRDSTCNYLKSDFITASRNDGVVAAIMYLGNTAGVTYNGRATLVSGIMTATQDFHGTAAISGTGSSGIYDIECWELVQNDYGIVNMWLPYPYKCSMLQTVTDTTAGQNVYDTSPDAQDSYQALIMTGGGGLSHSINSLPASSITLTPDGSGNVQFYLKLGPSVPPNGCKGSNLTICPNEVKVSGTGAQSGAISHGDLYSFGRDVEVFYPQANTGPQIINYNNSQGSYSIILPTTIAAYVRSYMLGSVDISRAKFTFGLNITYPGLPHPSFGYDPNMGCDLLTRDSDDGDGTGSEKGAIQYYPEFSMEIWQADTGGKVYGGNADAKITLYDKSTDLPISNDDVKYQIVATNPSTQDALNALCFLNQPFAGAGFTTNFLPAAAYQESGLNGAFRQFISYDPVSDQCNSRETTACPPATGVPMQAFDNGYGIMQITNGIPGGLTGSACQSPISPPPIQIPIYGTPTQDMIWNWVSNLNAGSSVMRDKYTQAATDYNNWLAEGRGQWSVSQLQMETWQMYNGGFYWTWRCADSAGDVFSPDTVCYKVPECTTDPQFGYSCQWIEDPDPPPFMLNKCKPSKLPQGYLANCSGLSTMVNPFYADCVKCIAINNPNWCQQ